MLTTIRLAILILAMATAIGIPIYFSHETERKEARLEAYRSRYTHHCELTRLELADELHMILNAHTPMDRRVTQTMFDRLHLRDWYDVKLCAPSDDLLIGASVPIVCTELDDPACMAGSTIAALSMTVY